MISHPEELRESVLDAYDVLGHPPRPELVALAELAARLAAVPMASVNLITSTEQWQVATYGVPASVCPIEASMCRVVLEERHPILLADASRDPRFHDHPATSGEQGSVRFYASYPLVSPEGVPFGTLCVFDTAVREVDGDLERLLAMLSAQVVHALQLELTARELAEANERLAAFAGQVSHDLKNPLAAVRMSLELARDELGEDASDASDASDALRSLVERSLRGAFRMNTMIDDLHEFARVGGRPEPAEVDLARLLGEAVEDLGDAVPAGRVRGHELPTVRGDAVQLRVVLQNLLGNATKFAPWDTEVEVAAVRLPAGWRITVSDRGPGVPVEHRERVFEPMVRLDRSVPGSGLGLATCRRIVAAHGGRTGIEDRPGGGAVVWFELPD